MGRARTEKDVNVDSLARPFDGATGNARHENAGPNCRGGNCRASWTSCPGGTDVT